MKEGGVVDIHWYGGRKAKRSGALREVACIYGLNVGRN